MVISNRNSFQVLFDKIASVYFISKIYFSIRNAQGTSAVPIVSAHFRSLYTSLDGRRQTVWEGLAAFQAKAEPHNVSRLTFIFT